jgi:hypothetical protein
MEEISSIGSKKQTITIKTKQNWESWAPVAPACNSNYLGGMWFKVSPGK